MNVDQAHLLGLVSFSSVSTVQTLYSRQPLSMLWLLSFVSATQEQHTTKLIPLVLCSPVHDEKERAVMLTGQKPGHRRFSPVPDRFYRFSSGLIIRRFCGHSGPATGPVRFWLVWVTDLAKPDPLFCFQTPKHTLLSPTFNSIQFYLLNRVETSLFDLKWKKAAWRMVVQLLWGVLRVRHQQHQQLSRWSWIEKASWELKWVTTHPFAFVSLTALLRFLALSFPLKFGSLFLPPSSLL